MQVGGRTIEIGVRVSQRVKRAKIVVDPFRNVEIVVPPRTQDDVVESLLFEHRVWLERQLAKAPKSLAIGLQRDEVVWIGGLALPVPGVPSLEAWYRDQARVEVTRVLQRESARLRIEYRSVSIRRMSATSTHTQRRHLSATRRKRA